MTSPGMDRSEVNPQPISVKVNNFPESPRARKTTMITVVLDPTGVAGLTRYEVCSYEPTRLRTVFHVIDSPCALLVEETPRTSPDLATSTEAPQGRILPNQAQEYVLFGPDAFWLNSITGSAIGRVTITKEYL